MTSESILGWKKQNEAAEQTPSETNVDARLNTLRETVLQLLDEVESLAISRPVDIKHGARFSDEVRQFEVSLIRTALGRTSGSQTRAANARAEADDAERQDQALRHHGVRARLTGSHRADDTYHVPVRSLFTAILTCGGRSLQQTDSLQWNWRGRTATAAGRASPDCRLRGAGFGPR